MKLLNGFYIYVLIASSISLFNNQYNLLSPTVLVSLIGIASAILFFSKKTNFYFLAIIWIVAQIPYFITPNFSFDLSQFLNIHLSLQFGSISFGINGQIFLLYFLKDILLSQFLFKEVSFKAYSENSILKRENEYLFTPTDIISKKLVGNSDIEIDGVFYSDVELNPHKSDNVKKGGITLIPLNGTQKINTTVEYNIK